MENTYGDSQNGGGHQQIEYNFIHVVTDYFGMEVDGYLNISDGVLVSGEGGYALSYHTQDSLYSYERRKMTNLDEEAYYSG